MSKFVVEIIGSVVKNPFTCTANSAEEAKWMFLDEIEGYGGYLCEGQRLRISILEETSYEAEASYERSQRDWDGAGTDDDIPF